MKVTLWPRVHVTLIHGNRLKIIRGNAFNRPPVSHNVSSGETLHFAVASLLTWKMLFKFFHQSMYCGSGRNWSKGNPSSKLATTLFMGFFPYKYFHKEFLCVTLCCVFMKAKTIHFTSTVPFVALYVYSWTANKIRVSCAQQMKIDCRHGSYERTRMMQFPYAWR
jgi:hypothetical protein